MFSLCLLIFLCFLSLCFNLYVLCSNNHTFLTSFIISHQNINNKSILIHYSIVILTFSIVFYWLSADISFVFRIFAITSERIIVMGSNFDSVYGLIMFFKNWNKIFKNYKNVIVLRDYRISLLFKQRLFCIRFGSYLREKASVWAEILTDGRVWGVLCNYEEKLHIKEKSLLFYRAFNFLLFSIVMRCFNPL